MTTIDLNILTFGDYAIPIDPKWQWMAMDEDGDWFLYRQRPQRGVFDWRPTDFKVRLLGPLRPPQPGPWTSQCYYIGE